MYKDHTINNIELYKLLKNIKSFKGVYMRDTLPKSLPKNKKSSGIVNLDIQRNDGTHWVCWYHDPKAHYVEYFDSFGIPPPQEVIKMFLNLNKKTLYNTS